VGSWGTPGMIVDSSKIFLLDNLESPVVGGARGAADRGSVSQNGPNK
jgi:hypothetical protein